MVDFDADAEADEFVRCIQFRQGRTTWTRVSPEWIPKFEQFCVALQGKYGIVTTYTRSDDNYAYYDFTPPAHMQN